MRLIGLARLGQDFEVRYTDSGDPVGSVVCAWGYGKKDQNGKQASQWGEFALWGDRAEKLGPYLKKGQQVFMIVSDVRLELFDRRDGQKGARLIGRVETIEFGARPANSGSESEQREPAPAPARQAKPAAAKAPSDIPDDDIPF